MEENKNVLITGTSNKYQIKKLKKEPIVIKKKKDSEGWDIPIDFFQESDQTILLSDLLTYKKSEKDFLKNSEKNHYKIAFELISKKISSYKQQDILKKRLNTDKFIKLDEVLDLLKNCKLECYYCKEKMLILYDVVRESKQWTLDRIDNDIGHNSGNCVISCLSCNLRRRRTSKDAFLFTKQLCIVKKDGIDDTLGLNEENTKYE
uniref:HNH endonuclease n=1 Tax=viral metagenome TaxID=1070528 RepID=A0A6C0KUB3_9ZZZZ